MKPLELTMYPPIHRPRFGYGIDPYREQWKRERKIIESKRLTDAELAAEYWKRQFLYAEANGVRETARAYAHMQVIHRFATLPHYDEVDA